MGRGGTPAREISFVSLVAYGPKVSDSALAMGVTASETRQGGSQQRVFCCTENTDEPPHRIPNKPSYVWILRGTGVWLKL